MASAYTFIETLRRLLSDPALGTKNTLFADPTMLALFTTRVDALTPDVVTWFGAADVITTGLTDLPLGSLGPDVAHSQLALDIDGFEYTLSRFRDGLQTTPRKLRRRKPGSVLTTTPADRVRYVLADPTDGVLLLDQNMEIVRTFPGLVPALTPITGALYKGAECAVAATIASTELMVIACGVNHCVQIVNYATGALVATIGTPGTAGIPTGVPVRLTDPVSVAVDEADSRLFVACRTGNPGTDVTDAGFVAEFDITVPASPVLVGVILQGNGLYRLNNLECRRPSDVFWTPAVVGTGQPPARLWVSNGLGDVASFERPLLSAPFVPSLVVEAQGNGWTLGPDTITLPMNEYAENAIDVLTSTIDTNTRLYVAASRTAVVEVFRASATDATVGFGAHEATYGRRGLEDSMPYDTVLRVYSTPAEPPLTFGVFGQATGVVADETTLPGETTPTPVLVVADADAGRLQRLRLPIFSSMNVVTFNKQTSTVPVQVMGWFLPADASFPSSFLTLEVRDPGDVTLAIPATSWREVPRAGFSVPIQGPALTRYQFRLRATVPPTAAVQAYSTGAIGVILRQSW